MDDPVEVREAGHRGKGIFARRDFRRGAVILRWQQGRVVRHDEIPTLSEWEQDHLSELTPETDQILPAPRCYANHACAPNAISTGDTLFAWSDIRAGDEITIDYRLNAHDRWVTRCECAAFDEPHLVIGDFFSLPEHSQRAYLPYAPLFIQEEYHRRRGHD
jgi:hypothetical protein